MSTQSINLARFARNAERDFFCDFQRLCNIIINRNLKQFSCSKHDEYNAPKQAWTKGRLADSQKSKNVEFDPKSKKDAIWQLAREKSKFFGFLVQKSHLRPLMQYLLNYK